MFGARLALTQLSRLKKSSCCHRRGAISAVYAISRPRVWCLVPRKGAAAVEFAFVAPIVFMLVLALIQYAGLMMNQNVLTAAAREGARIASLASTVSTDFVVSTVEERLTRGGIDPNVVAVDVNPTVLAGLKPGDEVSVSVSSPLSQMAWIGPFLPCDRNLSADIAYQRE